MYTPEQREAIRALSKRLYACALGKYFKAGSKTTPDERATFNLAVELWEIVLDDEIIYG